MAKNVFNSVTHITHIGLGRTCECVCVTPPFRGVTHTHILNTQNGCNWLYTSAEKRKEMAS